MLYLIMEVFEALAKESGFCKEREVVFHHFMNLWMLAPDYALILDGRDNMGKRLMGFGSEMHLSYGICSGVPSWVLSLHPPRHLFSCSRMKRGSRHLVHAMRGGRWDEDEWIGVDSGSLPELIPHQLILEQIDAEVESELNSV